MDRKELTTSNSRQTGPLFAAGITIDRLRVFRRRPSYLFRSGRLSRYDAPQGFGGRVGEAARVHQISMRCGGRLAARHERTAVREDRADRISGHRKSRRDAGQY